MIKNYAWSRQVQPSMRIVIKAVRIIFNDFLSSYLTLLITALRYLRKTIKIILLKHYLCKLHGIMHVLYMVKVTHVAISLNQKLALSVSGIYSQ